MVTTMHPMTVTFSKWRTGALRLLLACLTIAVSGCYDDYTPVVSGPEVRTDTLNVDVVLPSSIRYSWQNTLDWALENITKAQQQRNNRVMLRLRYHDENTEDLDSLAYRLANPVEGDDTCHAIIGPFHSDNAPIFLANAAKTRLPVVMPTCTSADLHRVNARNNYAWFLTESDITQCEVMLMAAHAYKCTDVLLVYEDNTYGRSFYDWFGYYATEVGLHIPGDGAIAYTSGTKLKSFLLKAHTDVVGDNAAVLIAVSNAEDYIDIIDQINEFTWSWNRDGERENYVGYHNICADTSLDALISNSEQYISLDFGISPYANMSFGFPQDYEVRYGRKPLNGEAQMYDALMIIAMGAAQRMASPATCMVDGQPAAGTDQQPLLTDYMRSVVSSTEGMITQWNLSGLCNAFRELEAGRPVDLTGVTGNLLFDETTRTQILNTNYMLWSLFWEWNKLDKPVASVLPILYLSTGDSGSDMSTTALWKAEKRVYQTFSDDDVESRDLPPLTDRWAVVVSPSTSWNNYRHQADAFAMYQTLRKYGYDDDHIVFIVEDNLANDPRNSALSGQIFVERSDAPAYWSPHAGEDVRRDAVVDYHFSDLRPDDLAAIMTGQASERLPHVIRPTATSDVFFFWSGHGGSSDGPLWGNEDSREYFGSERIRSIVDQMAGTPRMYRRMMLAVETCYSGKWGEVLTGYPDLIVLTAANSSETSKADVFDQQLGVFLSNAFVRTFRRLVSDNPSIPFYDLYRQLARTTTGSHVTIYNHEQYGSVYTETMQEYFPAP